MSASRRTTRAVAEVLVKVGALLHSTCGGCVAQSHRAIDHIKPALSLIQPQLVVGRHGDIGKVNRAPFDIEDPVGRTARHRCEDTAGSTRKSRAPGLRIGALVIPVREDRVVVGGPWQGTDVGEGRIGSRKLRIAVGRHVDAVKGLVVQRIRERQRNGGYQIVRVIAAIGRSWHDAPADLRDGVVVLRRTAVYRVIPREGRVRIASISGDPSGANTRSHAASEIEVHGEAGSHVAVDELDIGDAAANIAGQG